MAEYGIKCRIKSDAELNPRRLRNYTLLEEARQKDYSAPGALDRILECFPKSSPGLPLAELIAKAGNGFKKNDIYYGIMRRELRLMMTNTANELYFTKEGRSICYCWRDLRKQCEERGMVTPSKGAFSRHIDKMKNLEDSTKDREGKGVAYKYGTYDSVGKNWITAGDFPLKVAQMDGKTFDILVVDDETGEVLGKPTIGSCEHSFYYTQRSYYNAEETGAARKRQRVPGGMPGLHHRRWR